MRSAGPLAFALVLMFAATSSAQYFGANKVQYKTQDFQLLQTEHFDIYFHQDSREPADLAGRFAERWRARFVKFFGHELQGRQPIVMYSSHPDFEQTRIVDSFIDTGTAGFTEPSRRRMVLSFAGSLADTSHVLGHELVHAFQFDLYDSYGSMLYREGTEPLPLWLVEGLAEFLTLGPVDAYTAMWLRDAVVTDSLPRVDELDDPDRFPYRWGHALLAHISARWGEAAVAELYKQAMFSGVASAVERALGVTVDELSGDWHGAILEQYVPGLRRSAPLGRQVIRTEPFGGAMNVGVALSPDAKWLAFLSARALFGVDLFVADAETGEIQKRLTDTAADPRHSSLQFIDSAATWDAESRRLAVAVVAAGRSAILVFRWPEGKREREIPIKEVDEIAALSWSPDGRLIAFSGLSRGVTDLFIYDLQRSSLRRLTSDAFADLQPAWSPDGRRLAFVTDRFTTDMASLRLGDYRLALVNVADGAIAGVPAFATGKHLNPQWSADGASLYFVSDYDGTSDLYRVTLSGGTLTRLSYAATGLAGPAPVSPSMSMAPTRGRAAAISFARGSFDIQMLALSDGVAVENATAADAPAAAPSNDDHPVATDAWRVSKYRPRLSLEGMTEGSLAVGMDRFGAAMGTGLGVVFSDILNTHRLVGAVQMNQGFSDGLSLGSLALFGAYMNRAHRWNWGLVGSNVPMLAGVRSISTTVNEIPFATVSVIKQTERTGSFLASYALNRARRVEFQGGLGRLTFQRAALSADQQIDWREAAPPLTFMTMSAALVSDTTSGGATSVVRGERYRFEVAPVLGTLHHVSVLADYRRYLMPVPFYTIATRALHYGRYGKGAGDPRLTPLYLGYPALVRGYQINSLVTSECAAPLAEGCAEIDQLLGSRVAVGNVELRFPLLRPFGLSSQMYGPVPVEVALFVDSGVVWRDAAPSAVASPAGVAWSAGLTVRTNVLGFGLGQFDVARPFRGPRQGWVFQFNLVPAF